MTWNLASTATERSAADLYEACVGDDEGAIDEFVRRYQPELAGYARRHGAEDPEGMANLATFDTVRRLAGMRTMEEPAVRAYLYRALKGRLVDEHRLSVPQVSIDGLGVELTTDGPESPVLDQLEFSEMLELLTPAEREVVSHRFVGGYTSVETAARVGRSPDAVRRLQSNAIARLRLALAVAALLVAAGAGYWLVSTNPTVRTTDPIGNPTNQQLPDSSRRSSGQLPTTPGSERAPSPNGGIVDSGSETEAESGSTPSTTSQAGSTTEASTSSSTPEPSPGGAWAQGLANAARPDIGRPTTGSPATSSTTTTPDTTTPSTTGVPSTSAPPTTGPTTTSGETVETTTTRGPNGPEGNRGQGNQGGGPPGGPNGHPNGGPPGHNQPDPDGQPGPDGGPGRGRGPNGPN